ncbi:transmembrane protein, putative [Medicago truncatula]|uniref:Transmembrane protein, putative n=1 Tax=Medicago truncatula TaxID=3880 RepID=A0A072UJI9_MEDTR|nr:transmembrane protein, putative [Medicago truncatula]
MPPLIRGAPLWPLLFTLLLTLTSITNSLCSVVKLSPVPREILWKALAKKGVRVAYIRYIKDMYQQASTSIDVLTEHIQELAPRCMFFAYDVVLLGELREELNGRLET